MPIREVVAVVSLVALGAGLAAGSGSGCPRPPLAAEEGPEAERPWGRTSDGLRSRIRIDRPPDGPGDDVRIQYEIQNAGDRGATVWHSGFWPNHRIDLRTPDGEAVTPTPAGAKLRAAFDPEGIREKHVGRNLGPGEIDSTFEGVDLRGLFALQPGTYRAQVVYQEGRMKPLKSNELEFVIPAR